MPPTHSATPNAQRSVTLYLFLLLAALATLLAAMWAGLLRLGWSWPVLQPTLPGAHGPLMVCGFLGTVIGLERAVGLGRRWIAVGPLLTALGALATIFGLPVWLGALAITAGSAIVIVALVTLVQMQPALFTGAILLGGVSWFVGNLVWVAGRPLAVAALWWIGFLVFTIAGERLELSRLLRLSHWSQWLYTLALATTLAGMIVGLFDFALGMRVLGIGLLGTAIWLLRYDIARRRIKAGGLARFIALSLLSGYVWLAIGGGLALWRGGIMAGPDYDAILHSVFLGFVFTMIFAHAPIIFPAILKITITYTPRFYSHLVLLHLALALRVIGDLLPWWPARLWGGLLNAIVLLLFLVNTVTALQRQHSPPQAQKTA